VVGPNENFLRYGVKSSSCKPEASRAPIFGKFGFDGIPRAGLRCSQKTMGAETNCERFNINALIWWDRTEAEPIPATLKLRRNSLSPPRPCIQSLGNLDRANTDRRRSPVWKHCSNGPQLYELVYC